MEHDTEAMIANQIGYYRARAAEYDQWFLREGRYDRGPEQRAAWFAEVEQVRKELNVPGHEGDILELACGTGLWTQLLAQPHARVVAVDASPEVIDINRRRTASPNVQYIIADLFDWQPSQTFDVVFFGFWLSHVPPDRFERFWRLVRSALKPAGKALFVDSLWEQSSAAIDHEPLDRSGKTRRKLNDGREFQIVKIFYEPGELSARLHALGWTGWVRSTSSFFIYGSMNLVT